LVAGPTGRICQTRRPACAITSRKRNASAPSWRDGSEEMCSRTPAPRCVQLMVRSAAWCRRPRRRETPCANGRARIGGGSMPSSLYSCGELRAEQRVDRRRGVVRAGPPELVRALAGAQAMQERKIRAAAASQRFLGRDQQPPSAIFLRMPVQVSSWPCTQLPARTGGSGSAGSWTTQSPTVASLRDGWLESCPYSSRRKGKPFVGSTPRDSRRRAQSARGRARAPWGCSPGARSNRRPRPLRSSPCTQTLSVGEAVVAKRQCQGSTAPPRIGLLLAAVCAAAAPD
jgi:hypothetical protein